MKQPLQPTISPPSKPAKQKKMEKAFLDNAFALVDDTDLDDDDPDTTDVWGWPALLDALSKGQFEVAMTLLDKGASLACATPGGLTAIHVVSGGAGQKESVQSLAFLDVLLQRGADV
jgi:ankyrin repeat protein